MLDRERLKRRLVVEEGLRLKPYQDSLGLWTIGVGHLIRPHEKDLFSGGISETKAMELLDDDLDEVFIQLSKNLQCWNKLDDARQMVVADMAFNLGINKLLLFKNTLKFIEQGEWERASAAMLVSLWAKQVGKRADRLAAIIRTGVDDGYGEPR